MTKEMTKEEIKEFQKEFEIVNNQIRKQAKIKTVIDKVLDVKRLNNSVNGNPRYSFKFQNIGNAQTKKDDMSVYGYDVNSFMVGNYVKIDYRVTPKNKVIIENLKTYN